MQRRKKQPTGKRVESKYNIKLMKKDWAKKFAKSNKKKMTTAWHGDPTEEAMEEEHGQSLEPQSGSLNFDDIEEYLDEAYRLGKKRL